MSQGTDGAGAVQGTESLEPSAEVERKPESSGEASDPYANETAVDTARRAFEELKAEAEKGAPADAPPEGSEVVREAKSERARGPDGKFLKEDAPKPTPNAPEQQAKPEGVQIPQRFNAVEQDLIRQLPAPLQKALADMVNNHEAKFSRGQAESSAAMRQAQPVLRAIEPYRHSWTVQGENGAMQELPAEYVIAELAKAHAELMNPATSYRRWVEIGVDRGHVKPEEAQRALAGMPSGMSADIESHPSYKNLRSQLDSVNAQIQELQRTKVEASIKPDVDAVDAFRLEKDSSGNYLRPETHSDEYLDRTRPLVSALMETTPGLTFPEAFKRAWAITTGKPIGDLSASTQARSPSATNAIQQRAVQAAVSVRGKTAANGQSAAGEIPPDALNGSARDTAAWALAQLRRGSITN